MKMKRIFDDRSLDTPFTVRSGWLRTDMIRSALLAACLAPAISADLASASPQGGQSPCAIARVSVSSSGTQADNPSYQCCLSADGRFVTFSSLAWDLAPGDTNLKSDIFVHDRQTGATTRVSVSTSGVQANDASYMPDISGDGRYVVFWSDATNLVPGDTNLHSDVFLHDRQTGTTVRVSVDSAGTQGNSTSRDAAISSDGRYVAFSSAANNLVAGDTNNVADIFVHDMQTGQTVRASLGLGGAEANGISGMPALSADGRYVAFVSNATNLVAGDTNGVADVFVRDLQTGVTTLVHKSSTGTQANNGMPTFAWPSISADGRFVAFASNATNLVPGDTNGNTDVFVHDLLTSQTERVSVSTNGDEANWDSWLDGRRSISADGRFVCFFSRSNNLAPGITNLGDVYLRDRHTHETTLASQGPTGADGNGDSEEASMSADGTVVAFRSYAANFVTGDTNSQADIYARGCSPLPYSTFCWGDGTATACPCANSGASGRGCASSVDAFGAVLSAQGTASVSADTLTFVCGGTTSSLVIYFQGTLQENGGQGVVLGDGLRCIGGTLLRLGPESATAGSSQYPNGSDLPISVKGLVPAAGGTRTYQTWYRDPAAFCTPLTYNLSNGTQVSWAP
jgi:Tol biopolymer transport system component